MPKNNKKSELYNQKHNLPTENKKTKTPHFIKTDIHHELKDKAKK